MTDEVSSPMATAGSAWSGRRLWCKLVPAAVVVGVVIVVVWPARQALSTATAVKVRPALPALEDTLVSTNARTVQAAGWIEPAPFEVGVSAFTAGVVTKVHVVEGESVTAGQVLVELDARDATLAVRHAKAEVEQAAGLTARAKADVLAAQTHWDEAVERERSVATATAALAFAEAELARLPAQVREAEAAVKRWRTEVERLRTARSANAVTEVELRIAEADLEAAAARRDALVLAEPMRVAEVERRAAELRAARRGAELRIEEARALSTAKAALTAVLAELDAKRAALAMAELELERMTIRAPMDGNVLRRLVKPGSRVMLVGDMPHLGEVMELYDPTSLQVRVDVPLADAAQVSVGQRAEIVVDVLPDETFAGEVTAVTHLADLQKNTLEVKVRIDEPAALLKPDMLTRVRFVGNGGAVGSNGSAARVPTSAVVDGSVWVVRGRRGVEGQATRVPIDAVHVGDLVVLDPVGLVPGQRVRMEGGAS
ncbi:MAG: efflux RND transporter periplasmic adaptor subunit [Planctomycetota bacterium]